MKINKDIIGVLTKIDFVNRFLSICQHTNSRQYGFRPGLNELRKKIERNGYKAAFKFYSFMIIDEVNAVFTYSFIVQYRYGILVPYLHVKKHDEYLDIASGNFAFIYRYMIGNPDAEVSMPKYTNYEEFEELFISLVGIYEDFKSVCEKVLS